MRPYKRSRGTSTSPQSVPRGIASPSRPPQRLCPHGGRDTLYDVTRPLRGRDTILATLVIQVALIFFIASIEGTTMLKLYKQAKDLK